MVLIEAGRIGDAEFLGQRTHQRFRSKTGVRQIGGDPALAQRLHQPPAQQRLSGTDLAADLDETFPRPQRHQ